MVMISRETHEKYMADIQKQIDQLDNATKKSAEAAIKSVFTSYYDSVAARIEHENSLAEAGRKAGDNKAAAYHEMMAKLFKSILDNSVKYGSNPTFMLVAIGVATTFALSLFTPIKMPFRGTTL